MKQFDFVGRASNLPQPFDADRAQRGLASLMVAAAGQDAELGDFLRQLVADPRGHALLAAIFGNSPFLSQCLLLDLAYFRRLLTTEPAALEAALLAEVAAQSGRDEAGLMTGLRIAKRQTALLAGLADIAGLWDVPRVTGCLSAFAEAALDAAVDHLLRRAATSGDIVPHDPAHPARGSGLAVLGMGKLGARELNYSSDIDIIVLYDQDVVQCCDGQNVQVRVVKLTRDLVRLMQSRTGDGYVFRTDLRLRPDPGATPVALSMAAAEGYYESLGQNWERAAMIKARCVAGDRAAGQGFLDRLAPFVWRRNLDFAAIEDIHSIKRQINAHKGHGSITVAGHNIKLGRGGIREIEFFVQTQQLIAGGRDRRLRLSGTCAALRAFAETGRLTSAIAEELIQDYEFLRRLEHRLQMVADEQTHTLPTDDAGVAHIACFMGFPDTDSFRAALLATLGRVQGHYAALFESAPDLGPGGSLVFTGTEDDPETIGTLAGMGYRDPHMVADTVRGWHHGRYRATRSVRARELLTALMPRLLNALASAATADTAFLRFDEFLAGLPSGIQLFSLFYANPKLIDLVAEIMGTAPRLAAILGRNPGLLDAVLSEDFFAPLPPTADLQAELTLALKPAVDFQDVLDIVRRWTNDRKFQLGVQVLKQIVDVEAAGRALSDMVDAVFGVLVPVVTAEFARRHGAIAGGGMAVIGLGKLGGREMTFGSDLDLIFVYTHAPEAEASDGAQPLPPPLYYARLSQRVINALTALTAEGRLYEVDMRLRPSGNSGPIAVHIAAFEQYQRDEAWVWEQMAMTRARQITGPADLQRQIDAAWRQALIRPRDQDSLLIDVADMRRRIETQHGSKDAWNIKYVRGGLLDLEFMAQYLLLGHAEQAPQAIVGNTAEAFRRLGAAGLLMPADATRLYQATMFLRTLQGVLRLCTGGAFDPAAGTAGLAPLLARTGGAADFPALSARLRATEIGVAAYFRQLIDAPAEIARARTAATTAAAAVDPAAERKQETRS